nr:phage antirepressor [uncultured Blautia sp.]
MNDLQIFKNTEFGEIRTVTIDDEPWFVGKDVAESLGYERATKAIRDHVDEEDVDEIPIQDSIGRMQNTPVINESGLYSLVLSSKLASAKRFKKWVTSEVLPSIRKNGGYIAGQEGLSDDELMAKAVLVAQKKIEERDKVIEEQRLKIEADKPKTIFADAVSASNTSILIGDLAKLICQNGIQTGQKRLFEWMRENGYLIKSGSSRNMPTQKAAEMGLFEVKETTITNPDGSVRVTRTTKVTGKGQQYFINKFLG